MSPLANYYTLSELLTAVVDTVPKKQQTKDMLRKRQLSLHERNDLQKEFIRSKNEVCNDLNKIELAYFEIGKPAELFYRVLTEKPAATTIALLQAYLNNEIGIMDEKKHSKIIKHLETV